MLWQAHGQYRASHVIDSGQNLKSSSVGGGFIGHWWNWATVGKTTVTMSDLRTSQNCRRIFRFSYRCTNQFLRRPGSFTLLANTLVETSKAAVG